MLFPTPDETTLKWAGQNSDWFCLRLVQKEGSLPDTVGFGSAMIFSTSLKEKVSFGRRGTVSRGSADAPGILRAETNMRETESTRQDIEAAQGKTEHDPKVTRKM